MPGHSLDNSAYQGLFLKAGGMREEAIQAHGPGPILLADTDKDGDAKHLILFSWVWESSASAGHLSLGTLMTAPQELL